MGTGPARGVKARGGAPLALACLLALAQAAWADNCLTDAWDDGQVKGGLVFPNWVRARVASFAVLLANNGLSPETLSGLTVVNFGTAGASDLTKVYWAATCGATTTGLVTMTYAGNYTEDSGTYPAWTWAGSSISLSGCADYCGGVCGAAFTLTLYADIAPCPAALATVRLGLPVHQAFNSVWWGSLFDTGGCAVPWYDLGTGPSTIVYVVKQADRDTAPPGDTVSFTVTYGRPGTAPLASITLVDTLPPSTHFVVGSGTPAPDPGWDPDPGPPSRLRWTLPGGAVTGGPTGQVTFALTVDWGNGEAFEPGSGDTAAPEGTRLDNRVQVFWGGLAGCAADGQVSAPVTTVVRRFLTWMIGDNDVLFSSTPGQPPDEMTYSTFIKNVSTSRTWWEVRVWDTVPAALDPWCANCGFDDPCAGWTMTPSGCAAASPGRLASGGVTLLTWRLDLPPGATIELRWKAQVVGAATAGATALNTVRMLEYGRAGIVGGTGHSGVATSFTHPARIILSTTYVSYVGESGNDSLSGCPGWLVSFFPLNKRAQGELRGLMYQGAGFASTGGLSASIGCLIGDCLGGFPGTGVACPTGPLPGGGNAGCKVERIPASYDPAAWQGTCPTFPFHVAYKLTSNAPMLWQLLDRATSDQDDTITPAPSSGLTFVGMLHYAWRLTIPGNTAAATGYGLCMVNTTMPPSGPSNPMLTTAVHLFKFDFAALRWDYRKTFELNRESQAIEYGCLAADEGPWRTVSSDAELVVFQAQINDRENWSMLIPARETGHVVSGVGTGTFYGLVGKDTTGSYAYRVVVGNTGFLAATYRIWRYVPDNLIATPPVPSYLNGTSGTWTELWVHDVPAGLAAASNPRIYNLHGTFFDPPASTVLYKVELLSGGPIQIWCGADFGAFNYRGGGSVLNGADGSQVSDTYWLHQTAADQSFSGNCKTYPVTSLAVFAPRTGMAINAVSETGASATYTTTGPDECVSFKALTIPATKRNVRVTVLPGPAAGPVIAQEIRCLFTQKGYTAPFLQAGIHYLIVAPSAAFAGQPFWITVIVQDLGGTTRSDYCGTTSFSSTDPAAKLEGAAMDAYNFTWSSTVAPCGAGSDNGVRLFFNVTLGRLGLQTIVASDTVDGSIIGLAAIMVVGADVKLTKEPRLAVGASGDTVSFRVCWSNYSSASAFTFVITDAVPLGTAFLPEAGTASFDCGNTAGAAPRVAYSTAASTTPPAAFTEANPLAGTRWLRFTIPQAGVNTTGCVCYRVTVN